MPKKKQQSRAGLVTQGPCEETCVASAISILRKALGYKTGLPLRMKMVIDGKTKISWITQNCGKLFPDHRVECCSMVPNSGKDHNNLSAEEWAKDRGKKYVYFFGFTTFSDIGNKFINSKTIETHTVVGTPVAYNDLVIAYIVRIVLNKEDYG